MLSSDDNELICRVGPGTPMGAMFRRYWVPACLSSELREPDCDPIQVRLLGERLVAFRDSLGRVGLMRENCPHRGASLCLGRNEEGGLRCLYHGWKMDVEGNVLDTPCEQPHSVVRERVKHISYPVEERGDVVWAYLGPREKKPPFPAFQWTVVPPSNRSIKKVLEECNWLQGLEGAMDSPHGLALHDGSDIMRYPDDQSHLRTQPPVQEVIDTPYGLCYVTIRPDRKDPDHFQSIIIRPYVMPFSAYPFGGFPGVRSMHLFVPADDENSYYYEIRYHPTQTVDPFEPDRYLAPGVDIDGFGRKIKRRRENFYLQNRTTMRMKQSFTGIDGKPHEDIAMIETMGYINDRTQEHLGTSDIVLIRLRRRLLEALHAFADEGVDPPGLEASIPFERVSVVSQSIPIGMNWQEVGIESR